MIKLVNRLNNMRVGGTLKTKVYTVKYVVIGNIIHLKQKIIEEKI